MNAIEAQAIGGGEDVSSSSRGRRLILTQGDPEGVGPELLLRAAAEGVLAPGDRVFAGRAHLDAVLARLRALPESGDGAQKVPIEDWERGRASLEALIAANCKDDLGQFDALVQGVDEVLASPGSALVTAPIDKAVAASEGLTTPGHTEYLALRSACEDFAMAMVGDRLRLTLATIHLPLAEVPGRLSELSIERAGRLLAVALREVFGVEAPRIAVCGLNPHAGEGGLLGREDELVVRPAVEALAAAHPWASFSGPLPADAAFPLHAAGRFDGIVAMYHDQGLAPFKLLHFSDGVNMTLGLPFVRTSPDHGTAKDIAGSGVVDPRSFLEAIRLARG